VRKILIFFLVAVGLAGCSSKGPSKPKADMPPETHLFLVKGDSLGQADTLGTTDTTYSRLVLHWYGDDPDGEIIGYQYRWNAPPSDTIWKSTSKVADTFYVPIRSQFAYFTFYVRAIDNDSLIDPTPARMTFPVVNSPPIVRFPFAFMQYYDTARFTSFGYMTFNWDGGDPDGDETVTGFDFFLGDSSMRVDDVLDTTRHIQWTHLDSLTTRYTFSDLQPGFYRFFLRCQDVAGAYSPVIYYPDTTRGVWEVKAKQGDILYIDDNSHFFPSEHIFTDVLDSLYPGAYSTLNFELKTFYNPADIDSTLNLFHIVVWNGDATPHFAEASGALASFLSRGGRLMTNMGFAPTYPSDTLIIYSFMPIDSVTRTNISRPSRWGAQPGVDSIINYPDTVQIYPDTLFITNPISYSFAFIPAEPAALAGQGFGSGFDVLYVSRNIVGNITYNDTMAVRFPAYDPVNRWPARVIFFSFSVFDCDGSQGLFLGNFRRMFSNILQYEFR
jgi:hypothetical protein